MPPKAPVNDVSSSMLGTVLDQLASVARKLMIKISNVYSKPLARPKYHPLRFARRAEMNPPANEENPCTPNTHGSKFDSSTDEPVSIMERMIAPIASHMPDQYSPEATGDAIRKPPIAPVIDFKVHRSLEMLFV
jgi:hypothetical protein